MVPRTCSRVCRRISTGLVRRFKLTLEDFAGGGIVFDSVEEDEYMETINKLGANVRCIDAAEGESHRCLRLTGPSADFSALELSLRRVLL